MRTSMTPTPSRVLSGSLLRPDAPPRTGSGRTASLPLICWLVLSQPVAATGIYRWVDADGGVHFGDMPPANATELSLPSRSSGTGPDAINDEYSIANQLRRLSASKAEDKAQRKQDAAKRTSARPSAAAGRCWPPGSYCGPGRLSRPTYYGPFPNDHPAYRPELLPYGPLYPHPVRHPITPQFSRTRLWLGR